VITAELGPEKAKVRCAEVQVESLPE